jgi:hypothetical protein
MTEKHDIPTLWIALPPSDEKIKSLLLGCFDKGQSVWTDIPTLCKLESNRKLIPWEGKNGGWRDPGLEGKQQRWTTPSRGQKGGSPHWICLILYDSPDQTRVWTHEQRLDLCRALTTFIRKTLDDAQYTATELCYS